MSLPAESLLLKGVLDGWVRHNRALINLLRNIPPGGLDARILPTSNTVSQMFSHLHHERMISLLENAPEHAGVVPDEEWRHEPNAETLEENLMDSAARIQAAVRDRSIANRPLDQDFAHPVQLLQFLTFHEGYHHGQIKSSLQSAGIPITDAIAGPLIWDVWRNRQLFHADA